ncbi:phage tail sheath protein [Myxococcus sp. AM009]|uniref:phage tail sheath protein n=1 Tax=Myxococcus sp. AM009 TaxID=2745137 RepID=UPI001595549C|nr:phage tail sheath protein [Myxococcus sp. AM009]NVI97069.1 phage tail sheath protein [Myxococcus sp. AM009]
MRRLTFEVTERVAPTAPERMDVALFVGFVRRRPGAPVPAALSRYLFEQGWMTAPTLRVDPNDAQDPLTDVPLPFESFAAFERVFDWRARAGLPPDEFTALGAAVQAFFVQGGRKCYVVRMADPLTPGAERATRLGRLNLLLPGSRLPAPPGMEHPASAVDRATWHGAAHLFGLQDVSFLCLPDTPELVADAPEPLPIPRLPPAGAPGFVECATHGAATGSEWNTPERSAPRCGLTAYLDWAAFLAVLAELLRDRRLRETHLVAALPLPSASLVFDAPAGKRAATQDLGAFLHASGVLTPFQSAFIQLAYPWLRTASSEGLPERLAAPDGTLTGALARNALLRGTFRSALGLGLAEVREVFPIPTRLDQEPREQGSPLRALGERVTLLGPTPRGMQVLSDVTSSQGVSHRQAPVSRLISSVLRAARQLGADLTFSPSNEDTWLALRYRMESVLGRFFAEGALRGATPREAFSVRCDRTTMTQDDLDNGRLIALVELAPAAAIERVQVLLSALEGDVSLQQEEAA